MPPGKDGIDEAFNRGDPGLDFSGGEDDSSAGIGVDEQDAWDVGDCLWEQ